MQSSLPDNLLWLNAASDVPLQLLRLPGISRQISIVRLDQTHQQVSGNKWLKLKYSLLDASRRQCSTLISFGGPYSNHLHALAAAGRLSGLQTVGIVRGFRECALTPTLSDCQSWGMMLEFVSRKDYQKRYDTSWWRAWENRYPDSLVIPEGGTNQGAVEGVREYATGLYEKVIKTTAAKQIVVFLPVGSGGTLAGFVSAAQAFFSVRPDYQCHLIGVSALKGALDLDDKVDSLVQQAYEGDDISGTANVSWCIAHDFHFGGFAKSTPDLYAFMVEVEQRNSDLVLEPVYTSKMLWAARSFMQRGMISDKTHIIAVHTGGLQGRRGFDKS